MSPSSKTSADGGWSPDLLVAAVENLDRSDAIENMAADGLCWAADEIIRLRAALLTVVRDWDLVKFEIDIGLGLHQAECRICRRWSDGEDAAETLHADDCPMRAVPADEFFHHYAREPSPYVR